MPAKTLPLATLSAALLCALTMTPAAARAADLADANADADANAKTLDAVSVNGTVSRAQPATTTRLPLTLQETPQSVSVIGLQRLEDESLFSIDDVMRNVTGVNVSFTTPSARCISRAASRSPTSRSTACPPIAARPIRNTTPSSTTASK